MKKYILFFVLSTSLFSQTENKTYQLAQKYHNNFNASIHQPSDSSKIYLNLLKELIPKKPIYKVWYYQDLGYANFVEGMHIKSINYYQKSLKIAKKHKLTNEIINCKNWLANNYILTNNNAKAIQLYNEILELSKKENLIDGYIIAWTGLTNDKNLTINEQLKLNLKIDSICTQNNIETAILSNTYNWIGSTYLNQFNNEELAIKYFNKSLKIAINVGYEPGIKYVTMLLSDVALKNKEYKKAKMHYTNLIDKYKNHNNLLVANTYCELSNIAFLEHNYRLALSHLKTANIIYIKENDSISLVHNELRIAKINLELNNFSATKNSIQRLKKSTIKDVKYIQFIIDFSNLKSNYYYKIENFEKALFFYKKKDSLINLISKNENIKKFSDLETKYQTQKKEQKINLLQSEKKIVETQKINQTILLFTIIVILSLLGLFFFMLSKNRQKTTKKLQELDKLKSNFFTNISHEFRTPLTLISGPIQHQLKKENLSVKEKDSLKMMQRNSDRLLSLVDQLFDISKLEVGNYKLQVSNQEIIPFIGNIIDNFSFKAKEKSINYIINNNPNLTHAWFDKDALEKIITNLLSNAIKYTNLNGTIICNVFIENNQFYFEIKNTGKGINKIELEKIFTRFYQTNNNQDGVGIGLALVKELVNLHKGTITVTSILEEWTTFNVILPINNSNFNDNEINNNSIEEEIVASEKLSIKESKESVKNIDNPILLLVEDNEDVRTYISSIFSDEFIILQATNGQQGINLAIESIPDIIISDIIMPIKNGIELCGTLKIDERTSHIPIILLTAKAGVENEIEGVKFGADAYITKPFNEDLLKIKVAQLIQNIKKLQDRYSQEIILKPTDVSINTTDELFLNRLQTILDKELVESNFNSEKFCNFVGMSRMQLHRKLKALFNMTTSEFIRLQRLKLAADLLKKSDVNVSQIGYSIGFNNHAYFSKRFKETYGCTPTEYSKK